MGALSLSACGATPGGSEPAAAPHGSWQLVSGSGPEGPIEPPATHPITLLVEEAEVGGVAACNHYGASAEIDGDRLEIDEVAQTQIACEQEVMAAERAYLSALGRAERIERRGERLVVTGPSVELTFEELPPAPTEELVGTTWELETLIEEGDTARTPAAPARLRLDPDGTLDGHTGCRQFEGRYVVRGGEVRVTELATEDSGEPCSPEAEAQDRLVVSVVGDGFRAEVGGAHLTLASGDEALIYHAPKPGS